MGLASPSSRLAAAAFTVAAVTAVPLVAMVATGASAAPVVRGQAAAQVAATAANRFEPPEVTIPVGGTVTWTFTGGFHTVTGGENSPDPASPIGDSGIKSEGTYEVTFDAAGRFPYFCQPHISVGMKGVVIVGGAAGGGASPSPTGSSPASASAVATATVGSPAPAQSSTTEPAEGGQGVEDDGSVPGIEDNPLLEEIEAEEKANSKQIGGFQMLLWGITLATIAFGVAVFASTRTRRGGGR